MYDAATRFGSSPSSLQTGALARALTSTAIRLIGTSANVASNAIRAASASKRRPTIIRTGEIDPAEDELLCKVEDVARKAFALFELADSRLTAWQQLGSTVGTATTGISPRRKSSSSSMNSEVVILRQQEAAAGEAVVLFCKALTFIVQGTNEIQRYWELQATAMEHETSQELNDSESTFRFEGEDCGHIEEQEEHCDGPPDQTVKTEQTLTAVVQWLRARFNECYEKAEFAKSKCAEELPFVDRLLHDKARETVGWNLARST